MDREANPKLRDDSELVQREFDGELLVYDLKTHRAASLNPIAAAVWRACDGATRVEQIAERVGADVPTVWRALRLLSDEQLLAEPVRVPAGVLGNSRRDFVRQAALGALVAVPVVTAITAPTPAQAASCQAAGSLCYYSNPGACCSGACAGGSGPTGSCL